MYTIKETSQMLNIPASTLRYYEDEKILPPLKRSSGNQRLFDEEDIMLLKVVQCLKKTKMPVCTKERRKENHQFSGYTAKAPALRSKQGVAMGLRPARAS